MLISSVLFSNFLDFNFPNSFKEICFLSDKKTVVGDLPVLNSNRPGVYSYWASSNNNVISIPSPDVSLNIHSLDVKNSIGVTGYCCFKVSGKLSLRLKGAGKTVILSSGNPDVYPCTN